MGIDCDGIGLAWNQPLDGRIDPSGGWSQHYPHNKQQQPIAHVLARSLYSGSVVQDLAEEYAQQNAV